MKESTEVVLCLVCLGVLLSYTLGCFYLIKYSSSWFTPQVAMTNKVYNLWIIRGVEESDAASDNRIVHTFRNTAYTAILTAGLVFQGTTKAFSQINDASGTIQTLRLSIIGGLLFLSFSCWGTVIWAISELGYIGCLVGFESENLLNGLNEIDESNAKEKDLNSRLLSIKTGQNTISIMAFSFSFGFKFLFLAIPFYFYVGGIEILIVSTFVMLIFLIFWDFSHLLVQV